MTKIHCRGCRNGQLVPVSFCWLVYTVVVSAVPVVASVPQLVVEQAAPGLVSWVGEYGYSYFPEWSDDLEYWQPGNPPLVVGVEHLTAAHPWTGERWFARLGYLPVLVDNLASSDLDGDGLSYGLERAWGSDPMNPACFPQQPGLRADGLQALYVVDGTLAESADYQKASIQEAVAAAMSGDLILIREGVYREALQLINKGLTVAAWPGEQVILHGEGVLSSGFYLSNSASTISGITVQQFQHNALYLSNSNVKLERLLLQDCGRGIEIVGGNGLINNSIIRRNRGYSPGILVRHGKIMVEHCSLIDNEATSGAGGVTVESYVATNRRLAGEAVVTNSLIWNAGASQQVGYATSNNLSKVEVRYCFGPDFDGDGEPDFMAHQLVGNVTGERDFTPLGAPLRYSAQTALAHGEGGNLRDYFGNLRVSYVARDVGAIALLQMPKKSHCDADGDTLTDLHEYHLGTLATRSDSDMDGMSDAYKLSIGLNPNRSQFRIDGDGDGYPNDFEARWGTSLTDRMHFPEVPGLNPAGNGHLYVVDRDAEADEYILNTIQGALNQARAGDIVHVRPGVYTESLTIDSSNNGILLHFAEHAELSGVPTDVGIRVSYARSVRVHGGTIRGFRTAIETRDTDVLFSRTRILNNAQAISVYIWEFGSPAFENCLIADNGSSLPIVNIRGGRTTFTHCTFADNGSLAGHQVPLFDVDVLRAFSSRNSHVDVRNSLLFNPGCEVEIHLGPDYQGRSATAELTGNLLSSRWLAGDLNHLSQQYADNIYAYPCMAVDYVPVAESPAVAALVVHPGLIPFDIDGKLRDRALPTIGAFEVDKTSVSAVPDIEFKGGGETGWETLILNVQLQVGGHVEWSLLNDGQFCALGTEVELPIKDVFGRTLALRTFDGWQYSAEFYLELVDEDGDGLPDCWEMKHFQTLAKTRDCPTGIPRIDVGTAFRLGTEPRFVSSALLVYNF